MGKQLHRIDSEMSNLCPVCKTAVEDQTHFLTRTDDRCRSNFTLQLTALHKSLQKKKILGAAWSQIKSRLLFEMGYSTHSPAFPEAASHDAIARNIQLAVREHDEIGWVNFLRGRTSRYWGKAQGQYYQEADLASNMLSTQTFQTASSIAHGNSSTPSGSTVTASSTTPTSTLTSKRWTIASDNCTEAPATSFDPVACASSKPSPSRTASIYTHLSSMPGSGRSSLQ